MTRFLIVLIATLAAGAASAGPLPDASLKDGERACFSMAAEKGVTRLLLELHRELLNGTDPVTWGRVYAEVEGEAKGGYVYDGCGAVDDGRRLHCSIACDGGSFYVETAEGGVKLSLGDSGIRLQSCGSGVEGFNLGLDRLPQGAILKPEDDASCRTAMEPIEKMIEAEEAAID